MADDIKKKFEKLIKEKEILRRIVFGNEKPEVVFEEFALVPEDTFIKLENLKKEIEDLKQLVYKDELTKVLNRRGFTEKFEPLFREALYHKKNPKSHRKFEVNDFSLLFIDGDDFKSINDTYGHEEGDRILKEIAGVLIASVRDIDSVGRFGGEEFVVSLVGASEEDAYKKGEEIRKRLTSEVRVSSNSKHLITGSIGVASLNSSDADELDELIGYADQAMYEAKTNRGKNCVVKFSELKSN